MLRSLSQSKVVATGIKPLCLTNLRPNISMLAISLRLLLPGNTPVIRLSISNIVPKWSVISPRVNVARSKFNGFFSNPIGTS